MTVPPGTSNHIRTGSEEAVSKMQSCLPESAWTIVSSGSSIPCNNVLHSKQQSKLQVSFYWPQLQVLEHDRVTVIRQENFSGIALDKARDATSRRSVPAVTASRQ